MPMPMPMHASALKNLATHHPTLPTYESFNNLGRAVQSSASLTMNLHSHDVESTSANGETYKAYLPQPLNPPPHRRQHIKSPKGYARLERQKRKSQNLRRRRTSHHPRKETKPRPQAIHP
ncbi:MAG: hypothetical protein LQ338_006799 [Usnochroma carphineum]|nr:MAG: hypothetical protein LQ338_006799 [Usnochroma carphineum]